MSRLILLIGALGEIGCGEAEPSSLSAPPGADQDGGVGPTQPSHTPEWVRLGVGNRSYESLLDGAEVELVRGPQNHGRYYGYHIWLSVQAKGYLPEGVGLDFKVENVDTSTIVGDTAFTFGLRPVDDGFGAAGLRALIRDCCLAQHGRLRITLDLTDADGHTGHVGGGTADQRFGGRIHRRDAQLRVQHEQAFVERRQQFQQAVLPNRIDQSGQPGTRGTAFHGGLRCCDGFVAQCCVIAMHCIHKILFFQPIK